MEKQFVAFKVNNEHYCIDIMQVQEVVRETGFTYMPTFPSFVEGVINLRGLVTPIVSIYKKLNEHNIPGMYSIEENLAQKENIDESDDGKIKRSLNHKLIIVKVGNITIGLLVDALDKILTTNYLEIQRPESVSQIVDHNMVSGVFYVDSQPYIILDVDKILQSEEEQALNQHLSKKL
ncbi:MAG: chemotaxis protein CheW [Brevinemataceae bacterium]